MNTGLAIQHEPFAHVVSSVPLTDEVRALNCTRQLLPSFPTSNLKYWSATDAPRGSLHPFRSGQILNPYAIDYGPPFAYSAIPYPLLQQPPSRLACLDSDVLESRRRIGLTTFPSLPTRIRPGLPFSACLFPGSACDDVPPMWRGTTGYVPFG